MKYQVSSGSKLFDNLMAILKEFFEKFILKEKRAWIISEHAESYSKTCLRQPLKKKTKIGFRDRLLLYTGQKYCRMPQGEHSAILSTFTKLPFVNKIFVLSIFEWPLKTSFTVKSNIMFDVKCILVMFNSYQCTSTFMNCSVAWKFLSNMHYMGLDERKPVFRFAKNKGADQLGQSDQHLSYLCIGKYHI